MTKFKQSVLSALVVAGAFLAPGTALAGSYEGNNTTPCYGGGSTIGLAMDGVESAIKAGVFKNRRDQDNLLTKLANANSKTTAGKMSDAIDKLEDISNTATALADAAKPKLESADGINAAVLAAQGCLTGL